MGGLTYLNGAYGQIFVISYGKTKLTSGTVNNVLSVWCHEEGSIAITYEDTTQETHTFTDGDQFAFPQQANVAIISGTWSFMVA